MGTNYQDRKTSSQSKHIGMRVEQCKQNRFIIRHFSQLTFYCGVGATNRCERCLICRGGGGYQSVQANLYFPASHLHINLHAKYGINPIGIILVIARTMKVLRTRRWLSSPCVHSYGACNYTPRSQCTGHAITLLGLNACIHLSTNFQMKITIYLLYYIINIIMTPVVYVTVS